MIVLKYGHYIFFLFSLFIISCATVPKPVINEALTADEIQHRLTGLSRSLQNFSAEGSITVNTPTMTQSAGFELFTRGVDSMKMNVFGPFGITVGSALFTRNEFSAYNALNNTVYRGSPEKQMKMLPMISDIPFELLFGSLQGVHYTGFLSPIDSVESRGGKNYTFTYRYSNGSYDSYGYDESADRITKCIRKDSAGTTLWIVRYWYKRNGDGNVIPEQVEVSVPSRSSSLLIEYSTIAYEQSTTDLRLSYPTDAEIITIE